MPSKMRLGVNIDHAATLRNARGGSHPSPVRAALAAQQGGADGITAHLREDRRHIRDQDIARLRSEVNLPLNLEMAATPEMLAVALKIRPHAVCIVPEKREERTTEGGLDVPGQFALLTDYTQKLKNAGIRVSLFVNPIAEHLSAAKDVGADIAELHTGGYCEAGNAGRPQALAGIVSAVSAARDLGLECHAGHGLTFDTVKEIARIPGICELNIGHFLIGEALFTGLEQSVRHMRRLIDEARA